MATLCSECGNCLAYTMLAFQFISNAKRLKHLEEKQEHSDVEQVIVTPDEFEDDGEILDDLGIVNICCRTHTMSHNSLNDILAKFMAKPNE